MPKQYILWPSNKYIVSFKAKVYNLWPVPCPPPPMDLAREQELLEVAHDTEAEGVPALGLTVGFRAYRVRQRS